MGGSNCYLRDRRERKIVIKNGMEEYCSNFVLDKLGLDFSKDSVLDYRFCFIIRSGGLDFN